MRLVLALVVALVGSAAGSAQPTVGVRAGVAASAFRGGGALFLGDYHAYPLDQYERVAQPEIAVVWNVPLAAGLAVRPEVAFARRGGRQTVTSDDGGRGRIHTVEANYLQAVVVGSYRLRPSVRVGAGVYGGALVSTAARVYNRFGGGVSTEGTDVSAVETIRRADAGVLGLAAVSLSAAYEVDLRYARGLVAVAPAASGSVAGPTHDAVSLGLTVWF